MKKIASLFSMKLFFYDTDFLDYKKVNKTIWGLTILSCIVLISIVTYSIGRYNKLRNLSDYEKEILVIDLNNKHDFTQEKFIQMLKDLNVKYPWIVMAQARIESGGYRSRIFRENHNLFGMKEPSVRITTAQGTQYNHAYYNTWRESVYDYAFYQSRYMSAAKSEDDYYYILSQSYAEAPNYIEALKNEVRKHNLKSYFAD